MEWNGMEWHIKYQRALKEARGRMFHETCISVMSIMCVSTKL